jgi:hypothetical protein
MRAPDAAFHFDTDPNPAPKVANLDPQLSFNVTLTLPRKDTAVL